MADFKYRFVDNLKEFYEVENVRNVAVKNNDTSYNVSKFYYNDLLIIAAYMADKIVGAVYLTKENYNVVISSLFTQPGIELSNQIKIDLLKQVEENKDFIMTFFNTSFSRLIVNQNNKEDNNIYRECGYQSSSMVGKLSKHL